MEFMDLVYFCVHQYQEIFIGHIDILKSLNN